jgi:hypothetical protein
MNPRWTGLAKFSSVFLRLALGISFLSAVADRFGLWGVYGQPNVSWGNYARFVDYTAKLNWFLAAAMIPALAVIATAVETLFGLLLGSRLENSHHCIAKRSSSDHLCSDDDDGFGSQGPLNFSVFSAAGGALLLGVSANFPFSLDELLRRNKVGK